jgi:hypothetical protein
MGRTIIITERQLKEIVGADSAYLDSTDNDLDVPRGHTETFADGGPLDKIKGRGRNVTGDEKVKNTAKNPSWSNRGVSRGLPLTCSKKKTKIVEANREGENKTWRIPDDIYKSLKTNASSFNGDKNASGWDRLNNLINNPDVSYDEMRRLKNFFDNKSKNEPDHYQMICGDKLKPWVDNSLKSFTGSIERDKANRSSMGQSNVYQKAGGTKNSGNGQAHTPKASTTFNGKVNTF